ncbi:GntR family transcriptional regulator [Orrella sp. JC864]|uniref:GntR family transcriptional regulator n=1 Tax=Orrella sp. JC864 TaxID=3120298 RepID=UPI00300926FE
MFSANAFDPLWVSVAEPLRRRIVEGEIPPGQLLSENQLAQEFGVSRTPVREALRILIDEGLVEMMPGRKVRVAVPDPQDVREIYDVRWLLEAEALRRLAADPPLCERTCAQLQRHCQQGSEALAQQDRRQLAAANERFHETIVAALGNRRLIAQFRTIYNLISLYRHQTLQSEGWAQAGNADHARLVELIRAQDLDAALTLLKEHLDHARQIMLERMRQRTGPQGKHG